MRLGTVIGRVTLTQKEPVYSGGRLLIVQPLSREQFAEVGHTLASVAAPGSHVAAPVTVRSARESVRRPLAKGSSVVGFDQPGAGDGSIVGFTEGAEASQPFEGDAPVDAYLACIIDQISYTPPAAPPAGVK